MVIPGLETHRTFKFPWVVLATSFCFLFGLALIVNVHPVGDGLWFFYGQAVSHHSRLYSDLHLNQQPLFVLLTAESQRLLGLSWIASKALAGLQLLAYCVALYLLASRIAWEPWQRALVLLGSFFLSIAPTLYRFDDYHVTTQLCEMYSAILLLQLWRSTGRQTSWLVCLGTGILAGLSLADRLNDGAALWLGCILALAFLFPSRRWLSLLVFGAASALTLLGVIELTGDSLHAWFLESISHASKVKGGTGSVLTTALLFPFHMFVGSLHPKFLVVLLSVVGLYLLVRRYAKAFEPGLRSRKEAFVVLGGYTLLLLLALERRLLLASSSAPKLGQISLDALLVVGGWILLLMVRQVVSSRVPAWPYTACLLLIPVAGVFSTAMSSGLVLNGFEPEVALALLLAPFCLPVPMSPALRRTFLIFCGLLVVTSLPAKVLIPYDWHHYHQQPMFENRVLYTHPVYGPMLLQRDQLQFVTSICDTIRQSGTPQQLLSLPFPYPNYFCAIPPWHGYVQTWFDLSAKERIDQLDGELETDPPTWIIYQRELDTMRAHEVVYQRKHFLPHRALDRKIMDKLINNQWTIAQRRCFEGADWILIRTQPPTAQQYHANLADDSDRSSQCAAGTRDALNPPPS